jgi:L-iditol 2-dehydrogenase
VPFFRLDAEPRAGVLLEPLVIAYHQALSAGQMLGAIVAVQGAGAIGVLVAALAKRAGARRVILIGGPEARLRMGLEFGADRTINIETLADPSARIKAVANETPQGLGADVVFEVTGVPSALAEGLSMLRPGGTYVAAGHFTDAGDVALNPFKHFTNKHVRLVGVWGADLSHWAGALALLEANAYPFERIVSHTLPLERVHDAMQSLSTNYRLDGKEVGKLVIAPFDHDG